ncbi:G-type lectin S-receptor-like serine/threonine-protein kinase At1g11300 [Coffea arabica]|uniref:Receptor-like serine/threonine-protein kinase n=1 Tax=Coffea arabica TaxID=13443 RepID=A0A6P6T868_COFAR|nr:G-type lectin S-receptor-like serine/threonine-protein kinase At1g11330 [Coffea arabica]
MWESFVLLLACSFGVCIALDTITITQPIQDSETIVSAGQKFKLGFFSPENSSDRYVGIMYNLPGTAIIWVANRERPLNDSRGTVVILEDGNLAVINGVKDMLWSTNVSSSSANSSAQLLDTGNLVLTDESNGRIKWESFEHPTDCFLQYSKLGASTTGSIKITSWRSPSDPSVGTFSAGLSLSQIPQLFVWNNSSPYWRSGPWSGTAFIGIAGMASANYQVMDVLKDNSGSPYVTYNYVDTPFFYYLLSSSGHIRSMFSSGKGDWTINWSSQLSQCDVYGKCGPYGSCNPKGYPICTCLPGFKPSDQEEWNQGNWTGGCIRKELLQCQRNESASREDNQDGFMNLTHMKVPDFAEPMAITEQECRKNCLDNCSCTAYAFYVGIGCMQWSGILIDSEQLPLDGTNLYIRVPNSEHDTKRGFKVAIASTVSAAAVLLALCVCLCWKCIAKHKGNEQQAKLSRMEEVHKVEDMVTVTMNQAKFEKLPLYTYEALANATDNFHSNKIIGKGGFGPVYKGKLFDGLEIAVKRLSNSSTQGIEEFMNEVMVISKLQHRNLVRLLGCCVEREEKMLVYEYMPNKSLDAYLFDANKPNILDWRRRVIIVEGIGRALLYLHRDSRLKIIHRDLKASNILLDEELKPKLSDFGFARIFGGNQDQANTNRVAGTYGYMAPEYAMEGRFSEKSDVYSFGVLLLEIVSGRRNTTFYSDENELSMPGHAWKSWNENEAAKLIDPAIFDLGAITEMLRYIHVGLLCVQESAKDRPDVSAVLLMLTSEISNLPRPKFPAYTGRIGFSEKSSRQRAYSINDISLSSIEGR